jgi:hypothetical protein
LRECLALCEKKYAAAEPLLLQGYEGMKQREKTMSAQVRLRGLTNAVRYLVELDDAWGSSGKAAPWRKKLAEMKRSN